ncbi:reverse transcriptase domain-containing protein [Myroides sp. LJL115]
MEVPLNSENLLAQILSSNNMTLAYKRVKSNKGSYGIDKLSTENLLEWLRSNKESLIQSINDGKYSPLAVRRVEIPKEGGKVRLLGILTAVDRVVQQSIAQVLSPIYEKEFHSSSHGFRPKRDCHTALKGVKNHLDKGYQFVVGLEK